MYAIYMKFIYWMKLELLNLILRDNDDNEKNL